MLNTNLEKDQLEAQKLKHKIREDQNSVEQARKVRGKVATQIIEANFSLNEIELKASASQTKLNSLLKRIDKVEPSFSTLRRLQKLAKEQNSSCFKGLFIDYIDCPQQFYEALDIAAKKKLFSVVVEEMKDAEELLQLNKQIKGGVINIYPLEIIDKLQQKAQVEQFPEGSKSLLSKISLKQGADPRLNKLLQNVVGNVALVRDYATALKIA